MKTIRLPDPLPRGKTAQKLEWGSSAWAEDSCLVEWSRLEREWLDVPASLRPKARTRIAHAAFPSPAAWMSILVGMSLVAWYFID